MVRYILRPPLKEKRLSLTPDGVVLELKASATVPPTSA
ncbi:MAG: hypothetical protein H6726_12875 [Sandaracinaceae bacterium]|nr:hypothetical protein [Sandaracinaceae bacterium]